MSIFLRIYLKKNNFQKKSIFYIYTILSITINVMLKVDQTN